MRVDKFLDAGFQLCDAAIGAATDLFHGQLGEPPFDEAQPRAVGRREVDMESRTFGEPVSDQRCFMGAVVIHDDVHVEPTRNVRLNQIEEFPKLRGPVPLMKLRDHFTGLRVERGEQRRRAVAFVVVRPALNLSRLQRQERLGPIERLNLRLLIDAKHRRVRGWVQIEADDVAYLSTSKGSFDSLNVSVRCGCSPNVCQMRLIAV